MITIALASIFGITLITWLATRMMPERIRLLFCPICVGVSITWLWMLVRYHTGMAIDPAVLALLMGGTVVGLAYRAESRLNPARNRLLWKVLFIPLGFFGMFSLIKAEWLIAGGSALALALIFFAFATRAKEHPPEQRVEEIEEKLKQCC